MATLCLILIIFCVVCVVVVWVFVCVLSIYWQKKYYYLHNQHTLQYLRFEKQASFVFLLYFTVNVSMHQTRDLLLTTIPFYICDNVYVLRHIGTITQTKWGNILWKMYTHTVIQASFGKHGTYHINVGIIIFDPVWTQKRNWNIQIRN